MKNSIFDLASYSLNPDFFDEHKTFESNENEILNHEKKSYFFDKEKIIIPNLKEDYCCEMKENQVNFFSHFLLILIE